MNYSTRIKNFFQQKNINKNTLNKQFEDFPRRIRLRAHFKSKENYNLSTEEDSFKNPTNQNWVPTNHNHSMETFIKATRNEVKEKIEKP